MKFAPSAGHAFAVGAEVETRDSILLTYFVDAGLLRILRNRGKRAGSFLLSKVRHMARRAND